MQGRHYQFITLIFSFASFLSQSVTASHLLLLSNTNVPLPAYSKFTDIILVEFNLHHLLSYSIILELHPFNILISTLLLSVLLALDDYGFWETTIFGPYCCFAATLEAGLLLIFMSGFVDVYAGVWFVGFLSILEDLELFYFVNSLFLLTYSTFFEIGTLLTSRTWDLD